MCDKATINSIRPHAWTCEKSPSRSVKANKNPQRNSSCARSFTKSHSKHTKHKGMALWQQKRSQLTA